MALSVLDFNEGKQFPLLCLPKCWCGPANPSTSVAELTKLEEQEEQLLREEETERTRLEEERRREEERLLEERRLWQEHQEQQQQLEANQRKKVLQKFLMRHGFTGINDPQMNGCLVFGKTMTYPLHCAAKLGDARVVEALLKAGARVSQTDSSGKTALQVAQQKRKIGSHAVLRLLASDSTRPPVREA